MKTESTGWMSSPAMKNLGLLLLRLAVGGIFIYYGWMKVSNIAGPTELFEGLGFPAPAFFAWVVGLVELVGGAAIVLGIMSRLFGLLLFVVMVGAVLLIHLNAGFDSQFQLVLALAGGCAALVGNGGGAWSVWSKGDRM